MNEQPKKLTPHDRNRRDVFAAAALAGLLATDGTERNSRGEIVEMAVSYAELLIEELDKEPSK